MDILKKTLISLSFLSFMLTGLSAYAQKNESMIESVSVFGDSNDGKMSKNLKMAYQLGQLLAKQNKEVVLNGATGGILGEVLKGAYESKGNLTLITLPEEFDALCPQKHFCRKLSYTYAETPEEKEMLLTGLGDVIVILPGGWEPLSLFARIAHEQSLAKTSSNPALEALKKDVAIGKKPVSALSREDLTPLSVKPIIFLNINHYWDNLRYLIDEMKRQKILSEEESNFIAFAEKPKDVLPLAQKIMRKQSSF